MKFFAWPLVVIIFFGIFYKPISAFIAEPLTRLVDRIKWLKRKDFEACFSSPDISKENKENLFKEIINLYRVQINQISSTFKGFFFRVTEKKENITGDGSSYVVVFEKAHIGGFNGNEGKYFADQNCKMILSWHILFSGVDKQEEALINSPYASIA